MDMSFHRRRRANPASGEPDLPSLLSSAAARQATSPTARAQSRIGAGGGEGGDPLVELFAPRGPGAAPTRATSFNPAPISPVNPRQRS